MIQAQARTPMETNALVFVGSLNGTDGSTANVIAAIYPPVVYDSIRSWACIFRCPFLFRYDKVVTGADERDAFEQAVSLLQMEFERHGVQLPNRTGCSLASFLRMGGALPWKNDDPDLDSSRPSYVPVWLSPVILAPQEAPVLEVTGIRNEEGASPRTTVGSVYRADRDGEMECWASVVVCPVIDPPTTKIFGQDASQAEELAEQFIKSLFEHHGYLIADPNLDNGQS